MKILFRSFVLAALVAAVMTIMPGRAFSAPLAPGGAAAYVPGEVLVKYTPSSTLQERKASIAAQGNTFVADLNMGGWTRVRLGASQTVDDAIAAYQSDPSVESVQPNYIYHITQAPNDPSYGQLWAFKNIAQLVTTGTYSNNPGTAGDDMNIEKAWDLITDCSGTASVVAVVDTGVNYNQQDLTSSMWTSGTDTFSINHGYNFVDNNNDPMDRHGHGTHVAGIIGAEGNNGLGTTGVCWNASIMAVRVLDASGVGTTATITQGVNFAVTHGAKVINMSLGGGGPKDTAFSNAITTAQNADVVVVVSAGNDASNNDTTPTYPCNFAQPNLICVAALDQSYALATFSNYGPKSVDVGAPGTNILSTWAGTNALIAEPQASGWAGWTFTTTKSGGWDVSATAFTSLALADPSTWPNGSYVQNTDDRAYRSFDLTGADSASLLTVAFINVISSGHFAIAERASGGDPFGVASPAYVWGPYSTDTSRPANPFNSVFQIGADISSCITATCSIGFNLVTGTALDFGAAVPYFSITTLALNSSSYNTINGTSMATPEVAGLATMLRAYNPQFTATDVVNAIKNGGRPTPSLAGKTSTGRAIDVMSSLVYINPPTGLTYHVQ
jgi:thermitase